jgi:hypothetical protein
MQSCLGSAGCFKKPTQIPNAGHPISFRFAQLKYEDLVANPEEALVEVYTKLELPIDGFAIESIQRHFPTGNN